MHNSFWDGFLKEAGISRLTSPTVKMVRNVTDSIIGSAERNALKKPQQMLTKAPRKWSEQPLRVGDQLFSAPQHKTHSDYLKNLSN